MTIKFLDYIGGINDYRVPGMITYPLEEILFATFIGLLCRAEDFDDIALLCVEELEWLRIYLPFRDGIPQPQTFRKVFALLDPQALEDAFAGWVGALQEHIQGVVAVDGKALRGSKQRSDGTGALQVVSAWACEAGLVLGQRAVATKSNEITAIPELLKCLALEGAIVTIDAMGTQKAIADTIAARGADYVLALKGNQGTLHEDVAAWFDDPALAGPCPTSTQTTAGHGRIEERTCRVAEASWLVNRHGGRHEGRHEGWTGLATIAQITAVRTDKKTGSITTEKRLYISSLPPDPQTIAAAVRAHWSIENNLHWQLDVTFREDRNRTRKDFAALNLTIMRRFALNTLKRDTEKLSLKRKQLKAALNKDFCTKLLTC